MFRYLLLASLISLSYHSAQARGCSSGAHVACTVAIIAAESHVSPFNKLKKESYSGYAVYGKDTIRGNISFTENRIVVDMGLVTKKYQLDDKQLRNIYLAQNNSALFLAKLGKHDHHFYRLLHAGRISFYDDKLDFSYKEKDIDKGSIVMAYGNKTEPVSPMFQLNYRKRIVTTINKVYQTSFGYKQLSWHDLFEQIRHLN